MRLPPLILITIPFPIKSFLIPSKMISETFCFFFLSIIHKASRTVNFKCVYESEQFHLKYTEKSRVNKDNNFFLLIECHYMNLILWWNSFHNPEMSNWICDVFSWWEIWCDYGNPSLHLAVWVRFQKPSTYSPQSWNSQLGKDTVENIPQIDIMRKREREERGESKKLTLETYLPILYRLSATIIVTTARVGNILI